MTCLTHGSILGLYVSGACAGFLQGALLAALAVWVAWAHHVRRLAGGGR
jgi:TRAP-type C4-dicarboxylate transport system permease large subunit